MAAPGTVARDQALAGAERAAAETGTGGIAAVVYALLYVGDQVGEAVRKLDLIAFEMPNAGRGN